MNPKTSDSERIKKAQEVYREKFLNQRCPVCRAPIEYWMDRKFETLSEHVQNPNQLDYPLRPAFRCSNKTCVTRKKMKYDLFWNFDGARYGGLELDECFINGNDAPFGSIERKINVEIYKKGVKRAIFFHPIFCLYIVRPMIRFEYKSDTEGNILKKTAHLRFLKRMDKPKNIKEFFIPSEFCVYVKY